MAIDWHVSSDKSTVDNTGKLTIGPKESAERVFVWAEDTDPQSGETKYAYAMVENETPYIEDLKLSPSADHAVVLVPVILRHNSKATRDHLHWTHTGVGSETTLAYVSDIPDHPDYTAMRLVVGNDETGDTISVTLAVDGVPQPATVSLPISRMDVAVSPTSVIAHKAGDAVIIESNVSDEDGATWGHDETTDTTYSSPDATHYRIAVGQHETAQQIRVWRALSGKRAYATILVDPTLVIIPDLLQVTTKQDYQLRQILPGSEGDFAWQIDGATDSEIRQDSVEYATLRVGEREASPTYRVTLDAYGQHAECTVSVSPSGDPLAIDPAHCDLRPGDTVKFTATKACDWSLAGASDPERTVLDTAYGDASTLIIDEAETASMLTITASIGMEQASASVTILRNIKIEDIPPIPQGDAYTLISDPPADTLDWEFAPQPYQPDQTHIAAGTLYTDPSELELGEDYRLIRLTASREGYTSASTQFALYRPLLVTPNVTRARPGEDVIITANASEGLKWTLAGASHKDTRVRPDPDDHRKCAVIISPQEPAYDDDDKERTLTLTVSNQYVSTTAMITLYDIVAIIDREVVISAGTSYQYRSEPAPAMLTWSVAPADHATIANGYLTVAGDSPAGTLTITAQAQSGAHDEVQATVTEGLRLIAYDTLDRPITDGSQSVAPGGSIKIAHTSTYPSSQLTWTVTGKLSTQTGIVSDAATYARLFAGVDEYGDHTYHVTVTEPGVGGRSASLDVAAEHLAIAAEQDTLYPGKSTRVIPIHPIPREIASWRVEGASSQKTRVISTSGTSAVLTVSRDDTSTEVRVVLTMDWGSKYPDANPETVSCAVAVDQGISIWPEEVEMERGIVDNVFDVRPGINEVSWSISGGKYADTKIVSRMISIDKREPIGTNLTATITAKNGQKASAVIHVVDTRPYILHPQNYYDTTTNTQLTVAVAGLDPDPAKYAWSLEWLNANSNTHIEYPMDPDRQAVVVVVDENDYNRKFCVALRHDDRPETLRCYITTKPKPKSKKMSAGAKAGIAIGSLLGIGALAGGAAYGISRMRASRRAPRETGVREIPIFDPLEEDAIAEAENNGWVLNVDYFIRGDPAEIAYSARMRGEVGRVGGVDDHADPNIGDLLNREENHGEEEIQPNMGGAEAGRDDHQDLIEDEDRYQPLNRDHLMQGQNVRNLPDDAVDEPMIDGRNEEIQQQEGEAELAAQIQLNTVEEEYGRMQQMLTDAIARCNMAKKGYSDYINATERSLVTLVKSGHVGELRKMLRRLKPNMAQELGTGKTITLAQWTKMAEVLSEDIALTELNGEEEAAKFNVYKEEFLAIVRILRQTQERKNATTTLLGVLEAEKQKFNAPWEIDRQNTGAYCDAVRRRMNDAVSQINTQWTHAWNGLENAEDYAALPTVMSFIISEVRVNNGEVEWVYRYYAPTGTSVILRAETVKGFGTDLPEEFKFTWSLKKVSPDAPPYADGTKLERWDGEDNIYDQVTILTVDPAETNTTITVQLEYQIYGQTIRAYKSYVVYNFEPTIRYNGTFLSNETPVTVDIIGPNPPPIDFVVVEEPPKWALTHRQDRLPYVSLSYDRGDVAPYGLIRDYNAGKIPADLKIVRSVKISGNFGDPDRGEYGPTIINAVNRETGEVIKRLEVPTYQIALHEPEGAGFLSPTGDVMWIKYGETVCLDLKELPAMRQHLTFRTSPNAKFSVRWAELAEVANVGGGRIAVTANEGETVDAEGTLTLEYQYEYATNRFFTSTATRTLTREITVYTSVVGRPANLDFDWDTTKETHQLAKETGVLGIPADASTIVTITVKSPLTRVEILPDTDPRRRPDSRTRATLVRGPPGQVDMVEFYMSATQTIGSTMRVALRCQGVSKIIDYTCTGVNSPITISIPGTINNQCLVGSTIELAASNVPKQYLTELVWNVDPNHGTIQPQVQILTGNKNVAKFTMRTDITVNSVRVTCGPASDPRRTAAIDITVINWKFDTHNNYHMLPGRHRVYRVKVNGAVKVTDFVYAWALENPGTDPTTRLVVTEVESNSSRAVFYLGKAETKQTITIICTVKEDNEGKRVCGTIRSNVINVRGSSYIIGPNLAGQPPANRPENAPVPAYITVKDRVQVIAHNGFDIMRDTGLRLANFSWKAKTKDGVRTLQAKFSAWYRFIFYRSAHNAAVGSDPDPDAWCDLQAIYQYEADDGEEIVIDNTLVRGYIINPAFGAPQDAGLDAPWYMHDPMTIGTLSPEPNLPAPASTICDPADPTTRVLHIVRDPREVADTGSDTAVQQAVADAALGTWGSDAMAYISMMMRHGAIMQPMLASETITSVLSPTACSVNDLVIYPDQPVAYVDKSHLHRGYVIVPYSAEHDLHAVIPTSVPVYPHSVAVNSTAREHMMITPYDDGRIAECVEGDNYGTFSCLYVRALSPQTPKYGHIHIGSTQCKTAYDGWLFVTECPDWGYWPSYYAPIGYKYIYEPKHNVMPGRSITLTLRGIPRLHNLDTMRITLLGEHTDQRTTASCRMYSIAGDYSYVITLSVGSNELYSPIVAQLTHINGDTGESARYVLIFGPSQPQSVGMMDLTNLKFQDLECVSMYETHGEEGQYIYPTVTVDLSGLYQHILLLGQTATITADYAIAECNEIEGLTIDIQDKSVTITASDTLPYGCVDEPLHITFADESVFGADVYIIHTYRSGQDAAVLCKQRMGWGDTKDLPWDRDGTYRALDAHVTSKSDPTTTCTLYDDPASGNQMIRIQMGEGETYDPIVVEMTHAASDPPEYMYMLIGPDQYQPNHPVAHRYINDDPTVRPTISYAPRAKSIRKTGRYYKW